MLRAKYVNFYIKSASKNNQKKDRKMIAKKDLLKISIVIPLYNCEKYIEKTIQSVKNQSYTNWEMLIVDDCSTDNSFEIAKAASSSDERISLEKFSKNSGKAVVLEYGIRWATGDFIAFIDSDDIWKTTKLEKQITFMVKNGYLFSHTSYLAFEDFGAKKEKIFTAKKKVTYKDMLKFSRIGYSTVIIEAREFRKISIPNFRKRQDYAIWLKLLHFMDAYGLDECLTEYRLRNDSLSRNKLEMLFWNWRVYRKSENMSLARSLYYLFWDVYSKISGIK